MSRGIIPDLTEKVNARVEQAHTPHSTMIHYAKTCRATFEEEPFNEVDSLILSWIAYLRIPVEVLPKRELNSPVDADNPIFTDTDSCLIRDFLKNEYYNAMLFEVWSPEETLEMLYALAVSPRYEKIRLCLRREELDHEAAKQFSAISYQLLPDLTYIAFRGTDKTMTGWEEDFRLCLEDPVPSQRLAAEYLSAVGGIFRGRLIVGGHSKGGNLAVFAAANCNQEVQERIENIYSHDGPGFLKVDLMQEGFKRIQPRIRKTAPQFSVFGMLMRQETEPKIIYSYEHGIMQHNPTSWKTDGYGFSEYWYPDHASQVLKNKLNNWLDGLSNEERKMFIDTVFGILDETGLEKFGDLKTNLTEIVPVVIRELRKLEPEMQMFLFDLLKQLLFASDQNTDPKAEVKRNPEAQRKSRGSSVMEPQGENQEEAPSIPQGETQEQAPAMPRREQAGMDRPMYQSMSQAEIDKQEALDELNGKKKSAVAENVESIQDLMRKYDSMDFGNEKVSVEAGKEQVSMESDQNRQADVEEKLCKDDEPDSYDEEKPCKDDEADSYVEQDEDCMKSLSDDWFETLGKDFGKLLDEEKIKEAIEDSIASMLYHIRKH